MVSSVTPSEAIAKDLLPGCTMLLDASHGTIAADEVEPTKGLSRTGRWGSYSFKLLT